MKKIFLFFLLMFTLTLTAQTITNPDTAYWYTDYSEATKVAVAENKPILVLFTGSDWCSWCIRLQREVFSRDTFVNWSKEKVILVEIDFPRYKQQPDSVVQQNQLLQQQFNIQGYPTVWFVSATLIDDVTIIEPIGQSGYIPGGPQSWIDNANSILNGNK